MADIKAITVDLDNTLWDVFPVIERAERKSYQLLQEEFPRVCEKFSFEDIRDLRQHLFDTRPDIKHDFTELRKLVFVQMLEVAGYDVNHAEHQIAHFLHERNQVDLYPDVIPALERLSSMYSLISLSDGNSDLGKIGISRFFDGCIYATDVGHLKPHPAGFERACELANTLPEETLHIGDHPDYDINGARLAGLKTMWICRNGECWDQDFQPDYRINSMAEAVEILC